MFSAHAHGIQCLKGKALAKDTKEMGLWVAYCEWIYLRISNCV